MVAKSAPCLLVCCHIIPPTVYSKGLSFALVLARGVWLLAEPNVGVSSSEQLRGPLNKKLFPVQRPSGLKRAN